MSQLSADFIHAEMELYGIVFGAATLMGGWAFHAFVCPKAHSRVIEVRRKMANAIMHITMSPLH